MRVIVPAAGVGTRLRPLTDDRPKCLVQVAGRPLIAHLLERLADAGVDDVVLVTGYRADQLEDAVVALSDRPPVSFVRNADYASTNSIVSLALTRHLWDSDFCVVDADVAASRSLLGRLLRTPPPALVLDRARPPTTMDMRAELRDGAVVWLDHGVPLERTGGEFFGLSSWDGPTALQLSEAIDELLAAGGAGRWYEHAIRVVAARRRLPVVDADRWEWAEIDAAEEIPAAEAVLLADIAAPAHGPSAPATGH